MSLIEDLLSTGTGGIVTQLANQFGVTGDQAKSAVSTLVPSLAGGIKEKLADSQAAPAISQLIAGGGLSGFVDNPASLGGPEAAKQGNSILGMIFSAGDDDESGQRSSRKDRDQQWCCDEHAPSPDGVAGRIPVQEHGEREDQPLRSYRQSLHRDLESSGP